MRMPDDLQANLVHGSLGLTQIHISSCPLEALGDTLYVMIVLLSKGGAFARPVGVLKEVIEIIHDYYFIINFMTSSLIYLI